jgi:serine/threonine protein kinase
MHVSPPEEDALATLIGAEIPSELVPEVIYRILACIGQGAMSIVFYAIRIAPQGEVPVVIKILRPWFVKQSGATARLIVQKEAIALGRLNERIPTTPFVVRFIDTGAFFYHHDGTALDLPFVVVEYVHGGAEGTTLSERVTYSQRATGYAFDPFRAAHLSECLACGLEAVHEVGVIHRDVKPDNVLCCGFADDEIFKIADFGVARPAGVKATFGGMIVGTVGFAAPELTTNDPKAIGPWSDVFSLACVIFYVLTGEELFDVSSPGEAIIAAVSPKRRSILDARGLWPALRAHEGACRKIDRAILRGTSGKLDERPKSALDFVGRITPWLRQPARRVVFTEPPISRGNHARLAAKRLEPLREVGEVQAQERWAFRVLRQPASGRIIRSAAWDGDGRCMAATSEGLSFWNGATWREAPVGGYPYPRGIRFIRRVAAGQWILGGDHATLGMVTPEGLVETSERKGSGARFDLFSGELEDIGVLVGAEPDGPPTLYALVGKRWLKPLPVLEAAALNAIARIDDGKWLLAGRGVDGRGYSAIYSPLDWDVTRVPLDSVRALLASAGQWEPGIGLAVGTEGAVLWCDGAMLTQERAPGGVDLSAASVDAVGRGWAASAGRLFVRRAQGERGPSSVRGRWDCIWSDPAWTAPFISIFNDLDVVIAMTADGGILEGRSAALADTDRRAHRG